MRLRIPVIGFEKAWMASAPGLAAAVVVAVWWGLSVVTGFAPPSEQEIKTAVTVIVTAAFGAFGSYSATNSPRPEAPKELAE